MEDTEPRIIDPDDVELESGGGSLVRADEQPPGTLIVVPATRMLLFPGIVMPVVFGDESQEQAVEQAWNQSRYVGFLMPLGELEEGEEHRPEDFHEIGVAVRLLRHLKLPDGRTSIVCQSLARTRVRRFVRRRPVIFAEVDYPDDVPGEPVRTEALLKRTRDALMEVTELMSGVPDEFRVAAANIDDPGRLADFVGANFPMKLEERQAVLASLNVVDRLERVLLFLTGELEVRRLGQRIQEEIQEKIGRHQKEFFLREQLKAIRQELGEEVDEREAVVEEYEEKIASAGMSEEAEERALRELQRLAVLSPEAADYHVLKSYLDWLTDLPWSRRSEDNNDIARAERVLEEDHYGLKEVKERILEFLAVRKLKPDQRGAILCFAGPPGVGKTSLGRSIARALGREFFRFSLGGMRDEAEIKGHRRTYIGAMPGKIIQGLKRVGTRNPLFMLDEIDKLAHDWRGDPASALLEVLDPEQNVDFLDHYLDVRFDLSDIMFICTANVKEQIPGPLLDRMEVIELSSYIEDEKVNIAARYLLPRQRERHGLEPGHIRVSRAAYASIIQGYTREAGVRNLERQIARLCRKTAAGVARGTIDKASITRTNVADYLGPPRFRSELLQRVKRPGVAVGLAWTPFGGEVLFIECAATPGKGRLQVTGQLGDVMGESVRIALSYVKGEAEQFGVDAARLDELDIHVHFPAGAVPKDGPSAGITIATALISLLAGKDGRKVRQRLAMTGEITLTGRVLPVGGIREKVIAAGRAGAREVILPAANEKDLREIPEHILQGLTFRFAEEYPQVYSWAFPGKG